MVLINVEEKILFGEERHVFAGKVIESKVIQIPVNK